MQTLVTELTLTESELEILHHGVLGLTTTDIEDLGLRSNEVRYLADRLLGVLEGMACSATTATQLADDEDAAIENISRIRAAGNA